MVWGYNNFDDAFAAFEVDYNLSEIYYAWVQTYIDAANNEATGEDWEQSIRYCTTAIVWLRNTVRNLGDYFTLGVEQSHLMASIYYASKVPEAPSISLSSIIMAMYEATPTEITSFIGLVDAFRQSIWNRPFNREYFAELARGFEAWE